MRYESDQHWVLHLGTKGPLILAFMRMYRLYLCLNSILSPLLTISPFGSGIGPSTPIQPSPPRKLFSTSLCAPRSKHVFGRFLTNTFLRLRLGSTSRRSSGVSSSAKMMVWSASVSPLRMKMKSAASCSAWSTKNLRFARPKSDSTYAYVMSGRWSLGVGVASVLRKKGTSALGIMPMFLHVASSGVRGTTTGVCALSPEREIEGVRIVSWGGGC